MKDYDAIQHHIRAARLERSVALGDAIAGLIVKTWRGLERLIVRIATALGRHETSGGIAALRRAGSPHR